MLYVFFVYGLSFFVLGFSLLLYPKKDSAFWFARSLNYIAVFGLLHGLNEWLDMFILIHGTAQWLPAQLLRTALMGSSFLCLIIFGVSSMIKVRRGTRAMYAIPAVLMIAWLVVLASGGDQRFLLSDILGRYLLGAPGIFLTVYVLRMVEPELAESGLIEQLSYLRLAAVAFVFYGVFSGLIVPRADFFPASAINYDSFMKHLGVPVQVLRAACAVIIAYGMFRVLQVFDWESKNAIIRARDELEVRVEERTEDLVETNRELESEIAERTRAERFIKDILETVDEAFVVIDPEYRIVMANRAYSQQTKWPHEDIIGTHCYKVSHKATVPCFEAGEDCTVRNAFDTGLPYSAIHEHKDVDGNIIHVETRAFPLRDYSGKVFQVIETINDVTERFKLEGQLRQSQKMQAIGTLTGGIAHDFNNLLTTILGYGEFLQEDLRGGSKQKTYADFIVASAHRAANLTQSLLAFSRKQATNPEVLSVASLFKDIMGLLSRIIGEDVKLNVAVDGDDFFVNVDKGQMEQVLLNLVSNARDAMPEGGAITLSSELVSLDEDFISAQGYGMPGQYCLVSVEDEGAGMDESVREQALEPFFTTKDVGKGTGLGLSVAYGIMRQHEGFINIHSQQGKGTMVKLYLPLSEPRTEEGAEEPAAGPVPGGSETVLVAEDSESIRGLMKAILQGAGYRTVLASDGEEALRLFKECHDDVSLMLIDVVMPKMNGSEVYDAARLRRNDIKAIFMSGFSEEILYKKGLLAGDMHFIRKPLSSKDLLRKVREVIDS